MHRRLQLHGPRYAKANARKNQLAGMVVFLTLQI